MFENQMNWAISSQIAANFARKRFNDYLEREYAQVSGSGKHYIELKVNLFGILYSEDIV